MSPSLSITIVTKTPTCRIEGFSKYSELSEAYTKLSIVEAWGGVIA